MGSKTVVGILEMAGELLQFSSIPQLISLLNKIFRAPPKRTLSNTLLLSTARRRRQDDLWRFAKEPIRQPLLKKLAGKEELSQEACMGFLDILSQYHCVFFEDPYVRNVLVFMFSCIYVYIIFTFYYLLYILL